MYIYLCVWKWNPPCSWVWEITIVCRLQTQEHDSTVEYSHSILGVTVAGVVGVGLFSGLVVWPVYAIQRKRYHMSLRLFLTIPQMAAIGIYRELRRAKGHQQHHQLSGGMHRSISSHDMLGGDPLLDTESRHEMETAGLAAVQSAEDALVSRSHWAKELPFRSLVVVVVTLVVLSLLFAFSQRAADYSQEAGPIINHGCRRDSLLQTLDLFLCQSHQCIRVEDLSPHGGDSAGVQSLTTPLFSAAETLSQLTSTAKQVDLAFLRLLLGELSTTLSCWLASSVMFPLWSFLLRSCKTPILRFALGNPVLWWTLLWPPSNAAFCTNQGAKTVAIPVLQPMSFPQLYTLFEKAFCSKYVSE